MSHPRPSPTSSPIKKIAKFLSDGFGKLIKKRDDSSSVASVDSYDEAQRDAALIITRQIEGDSTTKVKILPCYTDPSSGCMFPSGLKDWQRIGPQGYGQSRPIGRSKDKKAPNLGLHVWALIAVESRKEEAQRLRANSSTHQSSHLCHNSRCFNEKHLVVETPMENTARKVCAGKESLILIEPNGVERYVQTGTPDGLPFCPHTPKCLFKQVKYYLEPADVEMA